MTTERGPSRALFLVLGTLVGVAAATLLSRRAVDVVEVHGLSMAPTLRPGDRLVVEALSYRYRLPWPGEIVLAQDPRAPSRELVKRVSWVDAAAATAELMGDAPDASTDSRTFGVIPLATIRWRVAARYWPPRRAAILTTRTKHLFRVASQVPPSVALEKPPGGVRPRFTLR